MFLHKVELNPTSREARRDLGDAYEMHRTLSRAFATCEKTPPHRFLWRVERSNDFQSSSVVLVQSDVEARWSFLESLDGYTSTAVASKTVNLETLIQPSRHFRFRLLANPTVTRGGKRFGLTTVVEQQTWLARQGERNGFDVHGCVRGNDERLRVRQGRSGHWIVVQTALFDGVLEIRSADAVRACVLGGLGHGKALGLGLLSLAPA